MRQLLILPLLACLPPTGAAAATTTDGISITGMTQIESLWLDGVANAVLFSKMDAHLRLGDGLRVGFDLGLDGVRQQDHEGDAIYAAGVIEGAFGRLSYGAPRLDLAQQFETPPLAASEVSELFSGVFSGNVVRDLNLLPQAPALRGLRYDGTFGAVTVSTSLSQAETVSRPLEQVAISYAAANWGAALGAARLQTPTADYAQVKAALQGSHGALSGGMVATRQSLNGQIESDLTLYANADVTKDISLGAKWEGIALPDDHTQIWGLSATYHATSGYFAEGGIASLGPYGTLVNLGAGFRF